MSATKFVDQFVDVGVTFGNCVREKKTIQKEVREDKGNNEVYHHLSTTPATTIF